MRSQTPIQQQWTTQTQLSRSRPHNPSLVRRIQSPGQRKSPLRQMQQQTRQRTTRQRQSTPLSEKRRRKRQTTNRSHANTTLQHMVKPHRNSNRRKAGHEGRDREDETTRETQWCSGITCVLAELRAHYPEHQHEEEKRKTERRGRQSTRPRTNRHRHSTMTQPCHKDTILNQQCCDSKHKERKGEEGDTTVRNEITHAPPQHTPLFVTHTTTNTTPECRTPMTRTPPHFPTRNKHDITQTEEERG